MNQLQANIRKSCSLSILRTLISGSAIITPSLPPYFFILAFKFPNALVTASFPGKTLLGPKNIFKTSFSFSYEFF